MIRGVSFLEKVSAWLRRLFRPVGQKKTAGRGYSAAQGLYWLHGKPAPRPATWFEGDSRMQWASGYCQPEQGSTPALEGKTEKGMDYPDYWLMKGETMMQQEQLAEANYCFDQALVHGSANAYALIYKGYCLYRLGSYDAAIVSLNQAALLDPGHPEINLVNALCLCRLQRFEEALAGFTRAIRRGLSTSVIWNNKGFCLSRLGRHREASAAFRTALNKCAEEESPEILCNAATELVELGAYESALDYFNRALHINPDDHVLMNNKALCMELLNSHDHALECYERALTFNPNDSTYLCNLGVCQLKLQRWDQAIASFRDAVSQEPGNSLAWCGLATACLASGRQEEALSCYNQGFDAAG